MSVIELNNISKRYGEVIALSRFNMNVKEGSITGFVGPNGAGKTTTLRLITGLTRPDEGTITVLGKNPYDNIEVKKCIGFVSEHDDLYPWATVLESVRMLSKLNMPESKDIDQAIGKAINDVGMEKYQERRISALSKGMKQRTKIAAALTHNPELLILDEPLGGLDPLGRKTSMDLLTSLCEDQGVTILISSHVLEELENFANRITLIHRGQTVAEGNPKKIRGLLHQYPHEIRFLSLKEHMTSLAGGLVTIHDLVQSISFEEKGSERIECKVLTSDPERFYDELVRVAVEKNSPFLQMSAISESMERLFEFLVR
ncbi:MAG: ABC transporter ATP-binding protein [Candidatus Thorarchaeota archaeon]